ncbi:hypothetical protein ACTXT7_002389 [Hymenolepis weldensis]
MAMCGRTPLKFQLLYMRMKFPPIVMVFGVVKESEGGHTMAPPFFPQGLKVNADADDYAETLQTIVAKPPWIDSVANGGRPCVFQQDSPPCHKALKPRIGWMVENFQHHVTPNL